MSTTGSILGSSLAAAARANVDPAAAERKSRRFIGVSLGVGGDCTPVGQRGEGEGAGVSRDAKRGTWAYRGRSPTPGHPGDCALASRRGSRQSPHPPQAALASNVTREPVAPPARRPAASSPRPSRAVRAATRPAGRGGSPPPVGRPIATCRAGPSTAPAVRPTLPLLSAARRSPSTTMPRLASSRAAVSRTAYRGWSSRAIWSAVSVHASIGFARARNSSVADLG